jgi:hypothetical protein
MQRHGVQWPGNGRAEGIHSRGRNQPSPDRIVLDIRDTTNVFLFRHDLRFVEAAHPHVQLAFQSERKAALDELHGLFKRNLWSGRDQGMEVFWPEDKCVQKKSSLAATFEDGSLKELCVGRDLEKAAALRRHCGHEVGTRFLRCQSHLRSIDERPAAKAGSMQTSIQGPEGPCSLRAGRLCSLRRRPVDFDKNSESSAKMPHLRGIRSTLRAIIQSTRRSLCRAGYNQR